MDATASRPPDQRYSKLHFIPEFALPGNAAQQRDCNATREMLNRSCDVGENTRREQANRGEQHNSYGTFIPTPIPQRPVYILPGSRWE